ncbi:solute:sodium symporter family transporter [Kiritimatiellaeota bacterium B1221]|nr:solute:sodium symporter family transporter [Kiritimatiellaeota bacterium B1221]
MVLGSFLFFTALVALVTYFITRKDERSSNDGYFLGGRSLTFPLIAGSLLLTNLSTEQMVGLNGDAFRDGLSVMVWEVVAVLALVAMALFFLPRFLRSGITTVPQLLKERFGNVTHNICNLVFLSAYAFILLPIILYTGATGMIGILDVQSLIGLESPETTLTVIVWTVGLIGSVYALFGGLRSVAVSDTINGAGLLVGGLMITVFSLSALGGSPAGGWEVLTTAHASRMNSIGGPESSVPFFTLFTGVMLLNFFYWTTNQQIIQRTLGASCLAEGQKGVLLTGALKLLGPIYLVLPGMIAFALFKDEGIRPVEAYGKLVNEVLPTSLAGFFAAVMMGAILSSFNSALNSTCTLFSLGVYKNMLKPDATDRQVVRSGKWFGWVMAVIAMLVAPALASFESIFGYLQKMNGIYFIPIFAVVLMGLLNKRVNSMTANIALIGGITAIALGYFVPPFSDWAGKTHEYHFIGMVFVGLMIFMLLMSKLKPLPEAWVHQDCGAVNLTPWKHAPLVGGLLVVAVILIYAVFADFSVL